MVQSRFTWNRIPEENQNTKQLDKLHNKLNKETRRKIRKNVYSILEDRVPRDIYEITRQLGYDSDSAPQVAKVLASHELIGRDTSGKYVIIRRLDKNSAKMIRRSAIDLLRDELPKSVNEIILELGNDQDYAVDIEHVLSMHQEILAKDGMCILKSSPLSNNVNSKYVKVLKDIMMVRDNAYPVSIYEEKHGEKLDINFLSQFKYISTFKVDDIDYVTNRYYMDAKRNQIRKKIIDGKPRDKAELASICYPLPIKHTGIIFKQIQDKYVYDMALIEQRSILQKHVDAYYKRHNVLSSSVIEKIKLEEMSDVDPVILSLLEPDMTKHYDMETLECGNERWYFPKHTQNIIRYQLCGVNSRSELGLPPRIPVKISAVWEYISERTALLTEAARLLKTTVPKVKVKIEGGTLIAIKSANKTMVTIQSLIENGATKLERTITEQKEETELNEKYPINRADLGLSPIRRGISGALGQKLVSVPEATQLLALERHELDTVIKLGFVKTQKDFIPATDVLRLIENRELLDPILNERLITTYEAAQMLGVTKDFVYEMDSVIKKRGSNEYNMNLYKRGDVQEYVGKVQELIKKVKNIKPPS